MQWCITEQKTEEEKKTKTNIEQTDTIMKTSGFAVWFLQEDRSCWQTKKWRIPVKKRVCHRPWHMIENRVTRYHICHFSAISLKNPGDFLQEINQQIFSTHPALQSRSYTPFLAACSQRCGAGFISLITCKYVCCHPEGDCTSLGLVVEWLETWLCLMRIHDDLCPPEVFRGFEKHAALEHFIFSPLNNLMDDVLLGELILWEF